MRKCMLKCQVQAWKHQVLLSLSTEGEINKGSTDLCPQQPTLQLRVKRDPGKIAGINKQCVKDAEWGVAGDEY